MQALEYAGLSPGPAIVHNSSARGPICVPAVTSHMHVTQGGGRTAASLRVVLVQDMESNPRPYKKSEVTLASAITRGTSKTTCKACHPFVVSPALT
jgi:hypothetical protein